MSSFFFSGSTAAKLDEKNRFVLPQSMRFGLVEEGKLEFTIALGLGGCLSIYRKSDIQKIAEKFRSKQHNHKYQKFFTLFFSTLHHTTCDKLGRVVLPSTLKKAAGIEGEIVIAGVLNKIEIWPKEKYELDLQNYLNSNDDSSLIAMAEEAFALLDGKENEAEEIENQGTSVESYFCDAK
ncbi:MAG: division/cell wall cluster transcriptional repressor MraZ [Simkaniaceae bacterium]